MDFADVLSRKLKKFKFGLLLIEGNTVMEVLSAGSNDLSADRVKQVAAIAAQMTPQQQATSG